MKHSDIHKRTLGNLYYVEKCYLLAAKMLRVIFDHILTTNLAAVVCVCVWMCVSVQNLTNFCPHALISNPNVPKILFA